MFACLISVHIIAHVQDEERPNSRPVGADDGSPHGALGDASSTQGCEVLKKYAIGSLHVSLLGMKFFACYRLCCS